MVSQLTVIKKPRSGGIPDHPINFPTLENLRLELLENKKKLKSGLPLISPSKIPASIPVIIAKTNDQPDPVEQEDVREKKKKVVHEDIDKDDEDMVDALGEDAHASGDNDKSGDDEGEDEDGEDGEEEDGEDGEEGEDEGKEEIVDPYAGMTPEEKEAMEKEEFIWRFRILKKKYNNPSVEIPVYNEHSDLPTMKRTYDRTIKELYLDESVETYRSYLLGSWIVMEFVATQLVGVDLSGFTVQQTQMMHKYDSLLIELGEKSRERWGMNLPVEVRLIGFILIQAGIFYLGKIIATKFGNNISELFKGVTGQPPTSKIPPKNDPKDQKEQNGSKPRGPRIKAADIRKMHSKKDASDEQDVQDID